MPGFLTHYLFGQHVTAKLDRITDSISLKTVLQKYPHVFNLGTQGPDLFLYYLPSNLNPAKKLGTLMHQNRTGTYFTTCLDYLIKPQDNNTREIFTAYLAGMFCHYALDSNCHPYIYARTGYDPSAEGSLTYLANHCQFESVLDSIMLQQLGHRLPSSFNSSQCIQLTKLETQVLASCLTDTINLTFFPDEPHPYTTKGFMLRAIKHLPPKIRFLHDTGGIKRPLIEWLELNTVKAHVLSCLFTTDKIKQPLYILNQNHEPWWNPWDKEKNYSSSFLDLYRDALTYSASCLRVLAQLMDSFSILSTHYGKTKLYKEKLLSLLGNLSYNTGLPLT